MGGGGKKIAAETQYYFNNVQRLLVCILNSTIEGRSKHTEASMFWFHFQFGAVRNKKRVVGLKGGVRE